MERTPLAAPIVHPPRGGWPVLLSISHSGRDYPDWLLANASGGRHTLECLEDPLVDRLAWRVVSRGIGAIVATAPRAAIDCNRSPEEIDPSVIVDAGPDAVGQRARGGLGIVPGRILPHARLWRRPIDQAELERRITEAHAPFHRAVADALDRIHARHGCALLIDCHSMPRRRGQAQIVLGDRHGASAAPWIAQEAARILGLAGWSVAHNDPYAGGYVVERHGRPDRGVHAIQVEIDRSSYLASDLRTAGPGFDHAATMLDRLVTGLAQAMAAPDAIAAE